MKKYELYACKYPAIAGMLIPALLTVSFVKDYHPQFQDIIDVLNIFVPTMVIYGALGFFIRTVFRDISKLLFQFPFFKEDETEMPTTKLLLHTGKKKLSSNMIKQITSKIERDFGIKLLSVAKEQRNLQEAKLTIVDAVGKIRECTRKNPNLLQYNIDFGFCRNYLGATIFALFLLCIILIVNIVWGIGTWQYTLVAIVIQILLGCIAFLTLKFKGYAYARALFNAYLSGADYEWKG